MKVKKVLKWTGIIAVAGLGGALIASPELRGWVVEKAQDGFNAVKGVFTSKEKPETEPTPKREGRNNGGYYKPRYNNKKN